MEGIILERRLRTEDLFESLGREDEQGDKRIIVEEPKDLENIINGFNDLLRNQDQYSDTTPDLLYNMYNKLLNILGKYSSNGTARFASTLKIPLRPKEFLKNAVGIYLSALINKSDDESFLLDLTKLKLPIDNVGFSNIKKVHINGNIGDFLGDSMKSGLIIVNGEVNSAGLNMKGGIIQIYGNRKPFFHYEGNKGEIYYNGELYCKEGSYLK